MGLLNKFIFDGVDSSDYDVLVSGEGVFNSPERDIEQLEIPGRNGALILDNGHFKNVEVTYPIKNHEASLEDFRTKLAGLRNALGSRIGYKRLEDTFHPDEFRLAHFKGPMEVDPIKYNYATDAIDITFDCKPQRFLKSGETGQAITSGDTLTNPTLFEAEPLLKVDGYGALNINDSVIQIAQGALIGTVNLFTDEYIVSDYDTNTYPSGSQYTRLNQNLQTDINDVALPGDSITSPGVVINFYIKGPNDPSTVEILPYETIDGSVRCYWGGVSGTGYYGITVFIDPVSFEVGTQRNIITYISMPYSVVGGTSGVITMNAYSINNVGTGLGDYDFTQGVRFTNSNNSGTPFSVDEETAGESNGAAQSPVIVNSTKSAIGDLYIDLEMGECYQINNGAYVPINSAVTLPANLPKLKAGANSITYDNTITDLLITPRWWKI